MIFSLVQDFAGVLDAMPRAHPHYRTLQLLDEAVRRDAHFIDCHPSTLLQCLWNLCWWYDCPDAERHFEPSTSAQKMPTPVLSCLLEQWRSTKQLDDPNFRWLVSLRPPVVRLGSNLIAVLRGHQKQANRVAFSPRQDRVVSCSEDEIRIWCVRDGSLERLISGHGKQVNDVAFTLDGTGILSALDDGSARVWCASTGTELLRLIANEAGLAVATFSESGNWIAAGGRDGTVHVWDAATGTLVSTFAAHEEVVVQKRYDITKADVLCVSFASDNILLTAGVDNAIRLWDWRTATLLSALHGHQTRTWNDPLGEQFLTHTGIKSAVFSPDRKLIVSVGEDDTMRIWASTTGTELWRSEGSFSNAQFFSDGRRIVFGMYHVVKVGDLVTGETVTTLMGHSHIVSWVTVSADGHMIAAACTDGSVCVWDASNAGTQVNVHPHRQKKQISSVAVSASARICATGSGQWDRSDGSLNGWSLETGLPIFEVQLDDFAAPLAFSPDGCLLAVGRIDGICLLRVSDGVELHRLPCRFGVDAICFSPDGRRLISYGGPVDRDIRVWNVHTGQEVHQLSAHDPEVGCMTVSIDGRFLATAKRSLFGFELNATIDPIRVWDLDTGTLLSEGHGHSARVEWLQFSPNGLHLASGSGDGTMRIWELWTGKQLLEVRGQARQGDAGFTPEGNYFYSQSDQCVRLWRLRQGSFEDSGFLSIADLNASVRYSAQWLRAHVEQGYATVENVLTGEPIAYFDQPLGTAVEMDGSMHWVGQDVNPFNLLVVRMHGAGASLPLVSCRRLWLHSVDGGSGRWDPFITVTCPQCGAIVPLDDDLLSNVQKAIAQLEEVSVEVLGGMLFGDWTEATTSCKACGYALKLDRVIGDASTVDLGAASGRLACAAQVNNDGTPQVGGFLGQGEVSGGINGADPGNAGKETSGDRRVRIRNRGVELIREGQADQAVDMLIGLVYCQGRFAMIEGVTTKDVLALAAALIEAGQYDRARSLALNCRGETQQAAVVIREVFRDWEGQLSWLQRIAWLLFGRIPPTKKADVSKLLAH